MRYLGNKESILPEIEALLRSKGLLEERHTFFDAFCGSGSVADYFKSDFDIIINDNLSWSVMYTRGRIRAGECRFERLGFDPFEYLNSNDERVQGFMYENYAPTLTQRMYFTPKNAGRIDYFRRQIESWRAEGRLTEDEYCCLMACLIESTSDVSNTAGVYGAYLKKWDARALKPIVFSRVSSAAGTARSLRTYNAKIEDIVADIDCDILYLDPPYTQNQYGTQYHLLETLVRNDNPALSRVTGSRPTAPMRSDWSRQYKANILFDRVLASTKAKYVLLSYSSDGFMSREFIEASMKRYGRPESCVCRRIEYKKYQNWKSQNDSQHFEYLFFVEMRDKDDVIYESPLNYIGSKARIAREIRSRLPGNIHTFYDAFGGGFNAGVNVPARQLVYNDINDLVTELIHSFARYDTCDYIQYVKRVIKRFGLKPGDREAYLAARGYYNSLPAEKRDPRLLFTVLLYGYQQQIRFNAKHDFNNPVGMRWFNDRVLEKMISFSRALKERGARFISGSYTALLGSITPADFVYFDPPYTLTTGAYNDGRRGYAGWSDELEAELFDFADTLDAAGVRFMLSYVAEHKGAVNRRLLDWIERRGYKLISLGEVLGISGSRRREVLIVNYDVQ